MSPRTLSFGTSRRRVAASLFALAFAVAPALGQNWTTTPAGDGCGGGQLTVTFTPVGGAGNHTILITATGLHPQTVGGMVFGVAPATIGPVLSPNCFVHTDGIWVTQFSTDANGVQTWSRSWPASSYGHYFIQLGSLDPQTLDIKLTNCVRAAHE